MKKDWDYYRLQWGIMKADMRERELLAKQEEYRRWGHSNEVRL